MAVLRVHRQASQLPGLGIGNRVQRRTGDDHALALDHAELLDLSLQHFARTAHQDALLFQRADQLQQATDVLDGRLAHHFELLLRHQRTATAPGEQLGEQRAVLGIADDVAARHTAFASLGRSIQQFALVVAA